MFKNVTGQKLRVFAFNRATSAPILGDAANITCKWSIDNAAPVPLTDTNPDEVEDGYYLFDITQAESNGNTLDPYPESSTPGVQVMPAWHERYTRGAVASSGSGGSGGSSTSGILPNRSVWPIGAGPITGDNFLLDRLNYDSATKIWPIASATLKEHIQLDHGEDDDLIEEYLAAATEDAENRANKAFIRQKRIQTIGWDLIYGGLSNTQVCLSVGPVISITAVYYLDEDGTEMAMSTSNFRLLPDRENIYFYGTLPVLLDGPGSVWVEYEAGYGDEPADVPAAWKSIVSQLAFRKYDYRGGDSGPTNDSFERMLDRMIVAAGGSRRG